MSRIEIVEVGPRDGLQNERVLLSTDVTRVRERAVGLTSLALWFGAALMGRGVGFW